MSITDLMFPSAAEAATLTPDTTSEVTAEAVTPEVTPDTPAAEPSGETPATEPTTPETVPTDAEGAEAVAAPDVTAAAGTTTSATPTPVTFTAMGHTFPVDGATADATGNVTIPATQWATTTRLMGNGLQWEHNQKLLRDLNSKAARTMQEAEYKGAEKDAASSTILTALEAILQDPAVAEYLGPKLEVIKLQAETASLRRRQELSDLRAKVTPEQASSFAAERIEAVLTQFGHQQFPALFGNPAIASQLLADTVKDAAKYAIVNEQGQADVNWPQLEADLRRLQMFATASAPRSVAAPSPKPVAAPAQAMNKAAAKPAPKGATSVTSPQGRDPDGRFNGAHPDMPTDPHRRAAWVRDRVGKGLPITA